MARTGNNLIPVSFFIILLGFLNVSLSYKPPSNPASTKHFVLVHGAGHGAWCWFKLIPLLRSSGYNVTAIDLAAAGINPLQISDIHTIFDYFQPLTNLLASLPANERVVVVGHSFGGLVIAQAMETFSNKIEVAFFVAAYMPGPSLNASVVYEKGSRLLGDLQDSNLTVGDDPNYPTSVTFGPKYPRTRLYNQSPIEDWILATTLIRASPLPSKEDLSSEKFVLTRKKYGSVKRVYIHADKDTILTREYLEFVIGGNPPDKVIQIFGSDHMVMISKPIQLWEALLTIAKKY